MQQKHKRVGNKVITTTEDDAIIPFADILATMEVTQDDDRNETPWNNCDGWKHTAEPVRHWEDDEFPDKENSIRYVNRSTREGGSVWLTLDVKKSGIPDASYYHSQGASKQVAAEKAARCLRRNYETLAKWYANGWEWWYVHGTFKDESAGCGGIDSEEYATNTVTVECAEEIAHALEKRGYTITDKPAPHDARANAHNNFKDKIRRQLSWE